MQAPNVDDGWPPALNWIFYNRKGIRSGWRLLAWAALSVAAIFVVVLVLVGIFMVTRLNRNFASGAPVWLLFGAFWLFFGAVFSAAVVVAAFIERRPVSSLGLGFHSRWRQELARGAAWGVALMSLVMLILVCTGGYRIRGFHEGLAPALEKLGLAMGYIEQFRNGGDTFAIGDRFSIADAALIPLFFFFDAFGAGLPTAELIAARPGIAAWWARAKASELGARAIAEQAAGLKALMAHRAAAAA